MMLSFSRRTYKRIKGSTSSSGGGWPIRDDLWHTRWRHHVRALIESLISLNTAAKKMDFRKQGFQKGPERNSKGKHLMSKESREYSVLSCHFKSLTPVSFACQCWWRDPVSRLGPNRREACSASQRSHFSSIHPDEPNLYYVTVIFIISFNYSSSSYLFSQVIRRQPTGLQS